MFPRKKRRLIVDFELGGGKYTGFTIDLSYAGLFIAANRLPQPGQSVPLRIHLPSGKNAECVGRVVEAEPVRSSV